MNPKYARVAMYRLRNILLDTQIGARIKWYLEVIEILINIETRETFARILQIRGVV
jgi:hypothetical protein